MKSKNVHNMLPYAELVILYWRYRLPHVSIVIPLWKKRAFPGIMKAFVGLHHELQLHHNERNLIAKPCLQIYIGTLAVIILYVFQVYYQLLPIP